jgi:hypothetical protein
MRRWIEGLLFFVACLLLSIPTFADTPSITLQTAYCFNGHVAPCDGGLAQVINNGTDNIVVDSIVASGWLSGHTDDITTLGGPGGGVTSISGGSSLIFNSFLFNSGDDTSNDGAVADPTKGIVFTITVHDTVDSSSATFTFFDNAVSGYSFVDGSGVALTGADCDAVACNGGATFVSDPGTPFTNPVPSPAPEPGSLALLGIGLTMIGGLMRWLR